MVRRVLLRPWNSLLLSQGNRWKLESILLKPCQLISFVFRDATPKRGKKKRKLIVDRVTQISKEEMAANREALNNNDEDELAPEWAMRPVPFWKSGKDLLENPTRRTQFSKTEFLDIARDIPRFEGFERNVVAEEQDDQVQEEPVIETGKIDSLVIS